eukprot:5452017-Prymnesium_polylepis.7
MHSRASVHTVGTGRWAAAGPFSSLLAHPVLRSDIVSREIRDSGRPSSPNPGSISTVLRLPGSTWLKRDILRCEKSAIFAGLLILAAAVSAPW